MTSQKSSPNPRVRLSPRGVVHIVWGKSDDDWQQARTVCGRKISDFPRAALVENGKGMICSDCDGRPVVTFTFTSGRKMSYYAR